MNDKILKQLRTHRRKSRLSSFLLLFLISFFLFFAVSESHPEPFFFALFFFGLFVINLFNKKRSISCPVCSERKGLLPQGCCDKCNGTGQIDNPPKPYHHFSATNKVKCDLCNGTGKCNRCLGKRIVKMYIWN